MWFIHFALQQLRARWQSLVTLVVGVLLAALIGANATLYTNAIAGVGLLQHLSDQNSADTNIFIRSSFAPVDVADFDAVRAAYDSAIIDTSAQIFGGMPWEPAIVSGAETQDMFVVREDAEIEGVKLRIAHYDDLQTAVNVVAGQLPQEDAALEPDIPVALHVEAAEALGVGIGDRLALDQRGWEDSQIFSVEIVALVEEQSAAASYWLEPSPLRIEEQPRGGFEANLLTTRAAFERVATVFIPQPTVQVNWRWLVPQDGIPAARIDELSAQVASVEIAVQDALAGLIEEAGSVVVITALPDVLGRYGGSIDLLNIPTGLILLQLGALVFFFLVVIAALVRRGERREIALLQSRGAQDGQILLIQAIEALVICLVATAIAPFVARATLAILVPLFTGIAGLPLELTPEVFAYAGGAAFLAFLVLIFTVQPVLRLPLIQAGGAASRSQVQTWWQRYYVDVVLMIAGGVALSQFSQERLLVTAADGTVQADPLLLLTPALLFVAFSSVMLRVIPVLMDFVARIATNQTGLSAVLAAWQVSREPLHYGRITFLLALAIGIGGFAITYQSTLRGNERDQAAYAAGADARVIFNNDELAAVDIARLQAELRNLNGVTDVSFNNRLELQSTSVSSGGRGRSRSSGFLLGIDGEQIAATGYNRADLNTVIPPQLDDIPAEVGRALPEGVQAIRVQGRLDAQQRINFSTTTQALINNPFTLAANVQLSLRLRDAAGSLIYVPMTPDTEALDAYFEARRAEAAAEAENAGEAEDFEPQFPTEAELIEQARGYPDGGWLTFTARLDDVGDLPQAGLRLDGVVVRSDNNGLNFGTARLSLADLRIIDVDENAQALDWLQAGDWSFVNDLFAVADAPEAAPELPTGVSGAALSLSYGHADGTVATFGLMLRYPELTTVQNTRSHGVEQAEDSIVGIPVMISRSFAEGNDLAAGQRFRIFVEDFAPWFEVTQVVDYYPSLYQDTPYMIADREALAYTLLRQARPIALPLEAWVSLNDEGDLRRFSDDEGIMDVVYTSDILQQFRTDTLSLGIIGLLYLSFIIGMVLSSVSLFTYVSLSVQSRRSEFAVLQAMGYPRGKLLLMLVLEQSFVLVTALVLGAVIGFFLSIQVLPPLIVSAAGGSATPPYIVRYDVGGLLLFALATVLVMSIVLLLSASRVWRSSTTQALRFDGE